MGVTGDIIVRSYTKYYPAPISLSRKMDALYDSGIQFILYLQKSWSGWENQMLWLSKFGDPRNAFLVYFPIVYSWSAELGISLLWTAVISEWYNLVLKW